MQINPRVKGPNPTKKVPRRKKKNPKKIKKFLKSSSFTSSKPSIKEGKLINLSTHLTSKPFQLVTFKVCFHIIKPKGKMAIRAPMMAGVSMASTSCNNRMVIVKAPPTKSSFFGQGVGTLNHTGLRLAITQRSRPSGSALGAQMNLFDRLARVIKSYANAIISAFEDPEKVLEQAVLEMNDDLIKLRQATAQVLASQKQMENKYKSAQQASDEWYRRAQLALGKGQEDLAREALRRRKAYADNAAALKDQLNQQKGIVDNLVSKTRLLESKIQEARSKKESLKARAQSAKTATKVTEMLGNVNTSSALSAFEKMEEKVMAMESQAEALNELTSDELEGKFALLENPSVDDDLANLKKELSGSSKKGELPAGRTPVTSSSSAFPFQDSEIEKELNELRRKAREF